MAYSDDGAVTVTFSTTAVIVAPYVTYEPLTEAELKTLQKDMDYYDAGFVLGNVRLWDGDGKPLNFTKGKVAFDLRHFLPDAEVVYNAISYRDYNDIEDDDEGGANWDWEDR
jgi:hypothetical protein